MKPRTSKGNLKIYERVSFMMTNSEKTVAVLEEMEAQAQWHRNQNMIATLRSLAGKTDNEAAKRVYENTIRILERGDYNC